MKKNINIKTNKKDLIIATVFLLTLGSILTIIFLRFGGII